MPKLFGGRPAFRKWVDRHPDPGWKLMPLTHITKGISAQDIVDAGQVSVADCDFFNEPLAYFFYGRPAYRVGGDGAVKVEAACPYCFIFNSALIKKAKSIYAFDTGAFSKRLYAHILLDEMNVEDFSLECDETRPNRLISAVFTLMKTYLEGDITQIVPADQGAEVWDFHARAYLQLLASPGRNEPDDRICTIEVVVGESVPLAGNLNAVIVPHTLWNATKRTPWLDQLSKSGVEIVPYLFVPGRHPEHYHALLEIAVQDLYVSWNLA